MIRKKRKKKKKKLNGQLSHRSCSFGSTFILKYTREIVFGALWIFSFSENLRSECTGFKLSNKIKPFQSINWQNFDSSIVARAKKMHATMIDDLRSWPWWTTSHCRRYYRKRAGRSHDRFQPRITSSRWPGVALLAHPSPAMILFSKDRNHEFFLQSHTYLSLSNYWSILTHFQIPNFL